MKIDDLAIVGLADPHFVQIANGTLNGGELGEHRLHDRNASGWRVLSGIVLDLEWLDVSFDFDVGAEFFGNGGLKPGRDVVRGGEGKIAVNFEIERNRLLPGHGLDR